MKVARSLPCSIDNLGMELGRILGNPRAAAGSLSAAPACRTQLVVGSSNLLGKQQFLQQYLCSFVLEFWNRVETHLHK